MQIQVESSKKVHKEIFKIFYIIYMHEKCSRKEIVCHHLLTALSYNINSDFKKIFNVLISPNFRICLSPLMNLLANHP